MADANIAHMVQFSIKDNPPPRSPTTLNHAFGDRSYPSLVEKIRYGDTIIKKQALAHVYDQFHKQENILAAVKAELIPALISSMMDFNEGVREEAARVFSLAAGNITARSEIVTQKGLPVLLRALKDPCENVRYYAHKAFTAYTFVRTGAQAALDSGLATELLAIGANLGDIDFMLLLLESLNNLIKLDPNKLLSLGALKTTMTILRKYSRGTNSENFDKITTLKKLCAECIAGLSAPYEGKTEACESNDVIESLIKLGDTSEHPDVQNAALNALMNITIKTEGKWISIKLDVAKLLLTQLTNSNINLIFVLKILTNLVEDPEGRKQLQGAISILKSLKEDSNPTTLPSIQTALSKLTFVP